MDQTIYACLDSTLSAGVTLIDRDDEPFIHVRVSGPQGSLTLYLSPTQARDVCTGLSDALYVLDGPAITRMVSHTALCANCGKLIRAEVVNDGDGGGQAAWVHFYVDGSPSRTRCEPMYVGGSGVNCEATHPQDVDPVSMLVIDNATTSDAATADETQAPAIPAHCDTCGVAVVPKWYEGGFGPPRLDWAHSLEDGSTLWGCSGMEVSADKMDVANVGGSTVVSDTHPELVP